jgi:hypothetical protein
MFTAAMFTIPNYGIRQMDFLKSGIYPQPSGRMKLCHLQENDGTGDHHGKQDKKDSKKNLPGFSHMHV